MSVCKCVCVFKCARALIGCLVLRVQTWISERPARYIDEQSLKSTGGGTAKAVGGSKSVGFTVIAYVRGGERACVGGFAWTR